MIDTHPITPPPELVKQLAAEALTWLDAVTASYRAGADAELEACVNYVDNAVSGNKARALRAARRPKPPSLAEQALAEIQQMEGVMDSAELGCDFTATRAALERLKELEQSDD